ncbi:MAG: BrnT family toxin [Terracidiphilus sp.]
MYIQMRYEWDERKNRENQRKHGVSFELASRVFDDERCLIRFDRVDDAGEQRWHALGAASAEPGTVQILLVAHVYREEDRDGKEIVRIISARRAGKNDVRRYQKQEVE